MNRLLIFGFILFSLSICGQEIPPAGESFRPVFSGGLVGSQVDGDSYGGYNKLGYFVGLGINRLVSKKVELEFALTLLQKGARKNYANDSASLNNPNNQFYLVRLNYLEVPLAIRYNYKRFKFEAGAAFAYLIQNPPYEMSQNGYYNDKNFKNFDFSYLLGVGYKLGDNITANLRYEYSLVPVRDYHQSTQGIYHGQWPASMFNLGLYNNLLILSLNYKLPPVAASSVNGQ